MFYITKAIRDQWAETRRLQRSRYPSPYVKAERNAIIVRMYRNGVTYGHLATLWGISRTRVKSIVMRARDE